MFGRKAFGPHHFHMTNAEKARRVARSIQGMEQTGRPWSWQQYGLEGNPAQQQRVLVALGRKAA
jgi:hypothetical protein